MWEMSDSTHCQMRLLPAFGLAFATRYFAAGRDLIACFGKTSMIGRPL
jgi:hypothetical protein